MRTVCIIQARMGSTRLPGKVLKLILDKPMLWWVVYRIHQCRLVDEVVIATTTSVQDDRLVELCEQEEWPYYRGSEEDVLDRYYQTAKRFAADCVMRTTSDCPLIDPALADCVIATYRSVAPPADYVSILSPRTHPRGLDTEVFSFSSLAQAWCEDKSQWREHVTPYIYNNPDRFRLHFVVNPIDFSHHRWTVDTAEDLALVRRVYGYFGHGNFDWREVLNVLEGHPDWVKLNCHIQQKLT